MNKRIKKKVRSKCVLCLDLASIPKGWDMMKWVYVYTKLGIAVYDSMLIKPTAPFPISTIPKISIKGMQLVDNAKFPERVNKLKEYNERIVSV